MHDATCSATIAGPRLQRTRAPQPLDLPSVDDDTRYAIHYWRALLRSLSGGHAVRQLRAGHYSCRFEPSARQRERWLALFGDRDGAWPADCPLLLGQSVNRLLYARLFADLGINLRHLLHLKHASAHPLGPAALGAARAQTLSCALKRCVYMGGQRVLVQLETRIDDDAGRCLAVVEDGFLVRQAPIHDVAAAQHDRSLLRELLDLRRRPPELDPGVPGAQVVPMPIAADAGRRFARVSGDLSWLHAGGLAARWLGLPRAGVQGMYLRHRALCAFAAAGWPVARLQMTFASPAYPGDTLQLVRHGHRFEITEGQRRVVAYGQC